MIIPLPISNNTTDYHLSINAISQSSLSPFLTSFLLSLSLSPSHLTLSSFVVNCTNHLRSPLTTQHCHCHNHRTSLWCPEFSQSVYCRSIHQLVAICKTNKKTTVVFRHPSDGKVSQFSKDLEFRAGVVSIQNLVPYLM